MTQDKLVDKHYGSGEIMEKIDRGLTAAGKDLKALSVDDLAPVDAFHTRGREATLELATLAHLSSSDLVLDVGCGLGGTARHLADKYGCQVKGIDLTQEYVDVGQQLTERVGLGDRVELRQGSALAIPHPTASFDVVWTEHVQMNIADKKQFYAEISRVLKPGGRFLFHDIFRGPGEPPVYPAPWAEDESLSLLATPQEARTLIELAPLKIEHWLDRVTESVAFFDGVFARIADAGPPPVGIHLLMGDNARQKLMNYARSLREERLVVALGLAIKE